MPEAQSLQGLENMAEIIRERHPSLEIRYRRALKDFRIRTPYYTVRIPQNHLERCTLVDLMDRLAQKMEQSPYDFTPLQDLPGRLYW